VRCPSSMGDGDLGYKDLGDIYAGARDLLAQAGDLAYFLEENDLVGSIAIDNKTGGVVATVFLAGETIDENFKYISASL